MPEHALLMVWSLIYRNLLIQLMRRARLENLELYGVRGIANKFLKITRGIIVVSVHKKYCLCLG